MPFLGSGFPLIPGLVLRLMLGFPAQALNHASRAKSNSPLDSVRAPCDPLPSLWAPVYFSPRWALLRPRHRDVRKLGGVLGCEPHLFGAPIAFLAHSCTSYRNSSPPETTIQFIDRHHQLGLVFAVIPPRVQAQPGAPKNSTNQEE